jgi:hypothetical protein
VPAPFANSRSPSLPHRLLAVTVAALVLLLSVLSVSHQLHADLHACGHDHGHAHEAPAGNPDSDESCVVTLFGQGITAGSAPLLIAAPIVAFSAPNFSRSTELVFGSPRYLHLPGRGPPLS